MTIEHSIEEVVSHMVFEADMWMPGDDESREEYFDSDPEFQKEVINKNMDKYFEKYMDVSVDGEWVSRNRKELIDLLWDEFSN